MAVNLGDVFVYIRGDDSKLGNDLRGAEEKTKGWAGGLAGSVFKTVGGAIVGGIAVATGAIVGLGAKAVAMAGDAEEMLSKFGVTFGDESGRATQALDDFADATGRNRYELMTMSADLGAVMKGMGLTESAAADMSVGFTQLAVDVGSFNNMQSSDVADRYRAALSGEYESLKALGVVINQAMVEQELLNMGIAGGAKEATQAELVQARYNLIMAASTDAMGDAERTSGSWTNQMVALKSRISETMTEIGLKLLPVLTPLLTMIGELAQQYLPQVVAAFTPFIEAFGNFVTLLMSGDLSGALSTLFPPEVVATILSIKDAIMAFWNETLAPFIAEWVSAKDVIIVALGAVAVFIGSIIGPIITPILAIVAVIGAAIAVVALLRNAWENNWGGIQEKTAVVIEFLKQVIGEALAAIQEWWALHGDEVIAKVSALWETLKTAFQTALAVISEVVSTVLAALGQWWSEHGDSVIAMLTAFWELVTTAFSVAFEFISGLVSDVLTAIGEWWSEHGDTVMEIVGALWEGIQAAMETAIEVLTNIFQAFKAAFEGDWTAFGENLREAWDALWLLIETAMDNAVAYIKDIPWKQIGIDIIEGMKNGVVEMATKLADAVMAAVEAAVEAAKAFLGIESPSKLFAEMGNNMTLGMTEGIMKGTPTAAAAAINLGQAVTYATGAGAGAATVDRSQSHVYNLYPRNDGQVNSMRNYVRMLQTLQEVA